MPSMFRTGESSPCFRSVKSENHYSFFGVTELQVELDVLDKRNSACIAHQIICTIFRGLSSFHVISVSDIPD